MTGSRGNTPIRATSPDFSDLSPQTSAPSPRQAVPLRPALIRNVSEPAASTSSTSLMTISQIYRQQRSQTPTPDSSKRTKANPGIPLPSIAALSPGGTSTKSLQKRILSTPSTKDYFAQAKIPASTSTDSVGAHRIPASLRLPTFQSMNESMTDLPSELHEGESQRPGLTRQNLSASKIYERRMKQLQEDSEKTIEEDILVPADITEQELEDEEVDTKYKEKLTEIKRKRDQGHSDAESDDVNLNSDEDSLPKRPSRSNSKNTKNEDAHSNAMASSSSSMQDADEKKFNFKNLLRRMTITDSRRHDAQSLNSDATIKKRNYLKRIALGEEDEFDTIGDDNLFTKFVNLSGGGLIPGASKEEKSKQDDEEAQLGPNDIPMQPLDPELFKQEASEILNSHRHHYANSANSATPARFDQSDESSQNPPKSNSDSFLAPNPQFYFHEDDNPSELNIDGGNDSYVAAPEKVRGGVLSSLLRLYQNPLEASRSRLQLASAAPSPSHSGVTTPTREHDNPYNMKSFTKKLKDLTSGGKKVAISDEDLQDQQMKILQGMGHKRVSSLTDLASMTSDFLSPEHALLKSKKFGSATNLPSFSKTEKTAGHSKIPNLLKGPIKSKREQVRAKITVHIAELLQRQYFIMRMAKALMLYGAPTHRLEDYLRMTARVLEIDTQFIYMPGVMIVSFGDPTTRTSEVQILRCAQSLDLYKLHRVHRIYKQVIHDIIGVEDASNALNDLISSPPSFSPWFCVFLYGLSSMVVTPWAYGGGWLNLPICFGIGLLVGFLQFIVSPKSNLYSNVFEVAASILVSFIARALGSISGVNICFGAVTQGCLALILPGWFILSGSLELQSRNLVSGSVRMFYAVIYSLLLGYGITLGSALYGWIDKNATDATTCSDSISDLWRILFVPLFTIGLALINQARLFQLPVMLVISCTGHVVSFFAAKHFYNSTQFTAAIASFIIGVMGNLYSRIFRGIAVSAMLPAIFVQIPGGMAAQDALLSGIESANQITSNTTTSKSEQALSGMAVGITLIQVCIGITVGLFASTIVVYPFGKKSTSVFTL